MHVFNTRPTRRGNGDLTASGLAGSKQAQGSVRSDHPAFPGGDSEVLPRGAHGGGLELIAPISDMVVAASPVACLQRLAAPSSPVAKDEGAKPESKGKAEAPWYESLRKQQLAWAKGLRSPVAENSRKSPPRQASPERSPGPKSATKKKFAPNPNHTNPYCRNLSPTRRGGH